MHFVHNWASMKISLLPISPMLIRWDLLRDAGAHAQISTVISKPDPRKNGIVSGGVPDVISPRRVHKHFRLMQMRNDPADIMKKITRHVVSIDNEGTNIHVHADTWTGGAHYSSLARARAMLMAT